MPNNDSSKDKNIRTPCNIVVVGRNRKKLIQLICEHNGSWGCYFFQMHMNTYHENITLVWSQISYQIWNSFKMVTHAFFAMKDHII